MLEQAIQIHTPGGPDTLVWEEVSVPEPGPGEVLLKQVAVGLNAIDIDYRKGLMQPPDYPFIPGFEGAGVVIRVGEGVSEVGIGDRVAYAGGPIGAYSRLRVIPVRFLVRIPEELSEAQAAGVLYRGLKVHTMVTRTFRLDHTHTILVNGAASGTGILLCEWARYLGATVIGAVNTEDRADFVLDNGCDHVINYAETDLKEAVGEITKGQGVHVVYDGLGGDAFLPSLACLRTMGLMICFAEAAGPAPEFSAGILREYPSIFITRPRMLDYKGPLEEYQVSAAGVLDKVMKRHLRINIMQTYFLKDAAYAHGELEAGRVMGSSVFLFD